MPGAEQEAGGLEARGGPINGGKEWYFLALQGLHKVQIWHEYFCCLNCGRD